MTPLRFPYTPEELAPQGKFAVLEGVSGIGKSTLAAILGERMGAATLHTLPEPLTSLSAAVNSLLRPLPQLAFYVSGLLHASDLVRASAAGDHVVADRYVSSVIACHAAVNAVAMDQVEGMLAPFRPYLVQPDRTFYLRASEGVLRDRLRQKSDTSQDDTDLFAVPGRLSSLLANFDAIAASDPSAVVLDTDDHSPDELAVHIIGILEGRNA
ncbi:thymidylate kinase [Streptomyces sp. NBC_01481]|uniref:dTMP kinase n=1 Tax=Streptomyces sp. NBC_01481 TaxID=2975869 RepID=UPI002256B404|nr:thymidylate kinase [Streptomyces sp. NBC_01481]MCX4584699.1 thymidylate kinase [Streptomyces sp. NBC_01481]